MKKRIIIMAVAIVLILSGCNPIGMFLQSVFESQDGDLRILYGPLKMNGCLSFRTTCIMFWISAVMMFPNIRRFPIPTA